MRRRLPASGLTRTLYVIRLETRLALADPAAMVMSM